jgi:hypothetical protein
VPPGEDGAGGYGTGAKTEGSIVLPCAADKYKRLCR